VRAIVGFVCEDAIQEQICVGVTSVAAIEEQMCVGFTSLHARQEQICIVECRSDESTMSTYTLSLHAREEQICIVECRSDESTMIYLSTYTFSTRKGRGRIITFKRIQCYRNADCLVNGHVAINQKHESKGTPKRN
jgi:hypothetical protein